jgi:anti-sigma factor RsiW
MNIRKDIPLRQAIRERFDGEQLTPEQLAELRGLLASPALPQAEPAPAVIGTGPTQAVPGGAGRLPNPGRRRLFAVAASVAATATVGYWGLFGLRAFRNTSNLQALADEIAFNHLYDRPLDVTSGSLDTLREAFAGIGFLLQAPPMPLPAGAELIGGRHCSIASVPAVMLRYRTPNGVLGFCQARFDPARHRGVPDMRVAAAPAEQMARGLKVSLCHDRGVLMAIAYA